MEQPFPTAPSGAATMPLYRAVEAHLRTRIEAGELVPGDLIPSESQLSRSLGVSQGTVKKALENLVHEGLLFRHQGKGTYVSRIDFNNSLFRFFSYGDGEGAAVRMRKETLSRALVEPPEEVRERLVLGREQPVLGIERVGLVDDEPVLTEHSFWVADLVPGLQDDAVHIPDLMYAVVVERFGLPVVRCEETLTAEVAAAGAARALEVAPGAPLLCLRRVAYTTGSRAIEFRITRGRGDRFSYRAQIR